ncbi:MAG: hypothetical protein JSR46_01560 [Verrucomicrobia bacterium]|nr:hypothetical protein [Verrucomicrobiota bacterium]
MNAFVCIFLMCALSLSAGESEISISPQDAKTIAAKIYRNECSQNPKLLISWNDGEGFLSLGIGHFIWYSEGKREIFSERFPQFIAFCKEMRTSVPNWLEKEPACPWQSKAQFLDKASQPQVEGLRQFLLETQDIQALFMIRRLKQAMPSITAAHSNPQKILEQFWRVAASAQGLYALIDYVNFKGEGVNMLERYNGHGWGLLQVLESMDHTDKPLVDFVKAAKTVLSRRVANAPKERNEQRWLAGWFNRVDTYDA